MTKTASLALVVALALPALAPAAEPEAGKAAEPTQALAWSDWTAGNDVRDIASLQRGARNFMNYCSGCHSLKYLRYSRLGADLHITDAQLSKNLIFNGDKTTDYIVSSLSAADGEAWFGKAPPDLSLMGRSRGPDYLYRFLKTFYVDDTRPTGSNNLALANAAMPAVLSELEGVKAPVYKDIGGVKTLVDFETVQPGAMTAEQYDAFVRDTVNFLDYVGEPAQVERRDIGVWVVLFLLVFTWLAWLLKKEYWKDVH
ncbi:MAG TPA: cytochrome c1 [Steroidobacteraceae bacterium]|nr:cytochrome c1 [Steroidobacteraceae bacterium]